MSMDSVHARSSSISRIFKCKLKITSLVGCFWNITNQFKSRTSLLSEYFLRRRNLECYKQFRSKMREYLAWLNTRLAKRASRAKIRSLSIKFPKKDLYWWQMLASKMPLQLKSTYCFKDFVPSISNTRKGNKLKLSPASWDKTVNRISFSAKKMCGMNDMPGAFDWFSCQHRCQLSALEWLTK